MTPPEINDHPQILVLDGNERNAELLGRFLEDEGYEPAVVADLEDVEEVLTPVSQFAFAIIDIDRFDGPVWPYCERLQEHGVPFIILSGLGASSLRRESREHGARSLANPSRNRNFVTSSKQRLTPMTDTQANSETNAELSTILIVEDETDLADLYVAWLTDTYEVHTAYNGEDALAKLDDTIDVVLLDRRMPGLSGDDVIAEIRDRSLDCRVVIVSGALPDFDIIGMGFDDYLTKPVDADDLHDAIERMLALAEYDESLQTLQQFVATKVALEEQKSRAELQANAEYADLQQRIAELRTETDAIIKDLTDEELEAAVRNLDPDAPTSLG